MTKFICEKCNREFDYKNSLIRHQNKLVDCDPNTHNLFCKYCNKSFISRSAVYKHYKVCPKFTDDKNKKEVIESQNVKNDLSKEDLMNIILEMKQQHADLIKTMKKCMNKKPSVINNNSSVINKTYQKKTTVINNYINAPTFSLDNLFDDVNIADYLSDNTIPEGMPNGIEYGMARLISDKLIKNVSLNERPVLCLDIRRKTYMYKTPLDWALDKVHYENFQYTSNIIKQINKMKKILQNHLRVLVYDKTVELTKFSDFFNKNYKYKIPEDLDEDVIRKEAVSVLNKMRKSHDNIIAEFRKVNKDNFSYLTLLKLSPHILFNKYEIEDNTQNNFSKIEDYDSNSESDEEENNELPSEVKPIPIVSFDQVIGYKPSSKII